VATKSNWIEEEFQRRTRRGLEALDDTARELHFQKAARVSWERLMNEVRADVEEFNRGDGGAEFTQSCALVFRVTRAPLTLTVVADLASHNIHYDYHSEDEMAAAPEGGIFSLRLSRYGRVDIFSADERQTEEEARRMLLEPVLFPPAASIDASAPPVPAG